MRRSPAIALDPRAERRALIALAAIFTLLVQALMPAFATAAPLGLDGEVPLCAAHGMADPPLGDFAPEPPCDHCLYAAFTAIAPAGPAIEPVTYGMKARAEIVPASRRLPPARAPPRPPGQGPPSPNA